MDLHRGFGDAQVAGDLLIQPPRGDLSQNRPLAFRQHLEARMERTHYGLILAAFTVLGESDVHSIYEILVPERLRQELSLAVAVPWKSASQALALSLWRRF